MQALSLIAGQSARDRIEQQGLSPDLVRVIAAASGSAKWLVLFGLDKYIFGDWLKGHREPVQLVGSSIGAWRMAVAAKPDPGPAFDNFLDNYFSYQYQKGMSAEDITRESYRSLEAYLGPDVRDSVVHNAMRQLNIVAVGGKGLCASQNRLAFGAGLGAAMLANRVSRERLAKYFDRILFKSAAGGIDTAHFSDAFKTTEATLTHANLHDAVMASGAIPFVTNPLTKIDGVPDGLYMDGGVIDYHFDVNWQLNDGIVLYPHFYRDITPGWFDKNLKRRAGAVGMDKVLLLAPSDDFVAKLPQGKIPERSNFTDMDGAGRLAYWRHTVDESHRMADELHELLQNHNKLMDRIETI